MNYYFILVILCLMQTLAKCQINLGELKCLVCQATVDELLDDIASVDPNKKVNVGNFRLDGSGNANSQTIPYTKSEVYLSDLLDSICNKMDDYVRAVTKTTKQLTLLRIVSKDGKMNPKMSEVDVVQDGDLNKSLKFYCEGILGDNEDEIIQFLVHSTDNLHNKVCNELTSLCGEDEIDNEIIHGEL
ncbi:protein seele [Ctenocephalides felis]|uniref:protein seele n=1 Tax=Ctenocephalides felis TaxID=7515 RepID=UPI000E6E498A|nr:protein seele [Ctenocephalides felis]